MFVLWGMKARVQLFPMVGKIKISFNSLDFTR